LEENIMKKIIALLLIFIFGITMLAGCSDKSNNGENGDDKDGGKSDNAVEIDDSSYGIDLTSTEVQQMSAERASKEKLDKTVTEWLEGNTMFYDSSLTYKDFVDYIGYDATEYNYDASYKARVYTWKADGSDNSVLGVWFKQNGNTWNLSMTGSTNLG
jgi:hypothetical protein